MNDIIKQIKDEICTVTRNSLSKMNLTVPDEEAFKKAADEKIEIEIPKEKKFGDFSVNTAMKLTKVLRTSLYSFTRVLPITKGLSKPIDTIEPSFMIRSITIVGLIDGNVILIIFLNVPAPSTSAAS